MSRDELQKLTDLQVMFIGSDPRSPSHLLRRNRVRAMGDDYVLQHYRDDEPETVPDIAVGYHELDDSELET
jgi:hypothetical protein